MRTYRGFSTANYLTNRKNGFLLTDIDVIKQDLYNHIYTLKGERPHQTWFGTRIPELHFEGIDERTISIIKEDITEVFTYDPRVELIDLAISPLPDINSIVIFIDMRYVELDKKETLKLVFGSK